MRATQDCKLTLKSGSFIQFRADSSKYETIRHDNGYDYPAICFYIKDQLVARFHRSEVRCHTSPV